MLLLDEVDALVGDTLIALPRRADAGAVAADGAGDGAGVSPLASSSPTPAQATDPDFR